VEYATKQDSSLNRYTGFASLHNVTTDEGAVIGIQHYNTMHQSLLAYGTTKCKIHGLDLRMQKEPWILNNSLNLGLLSCFLIEPSKNWMITGTNSGYYTCWDLRFQLPVKIWRDPSKMRIHKIVYSYDPTNNRSNGSCIFSTSGNKNQVSVWDIQTSTCKEVYRLMPSAMDYVEDRNIMMPLPPRDPIDYGIDELGSAIPSHDTIANHNSNSNTYSNTIPRRTDGGIKTILNPSNCPYFITAGDDKKIRYWNRTNISNSYVICGLKEGEHKPVYRHHVIDDTLNVYQEIAVQEDDFGHSNHKKMRYI
jgi:phosphoinositide-3-kinase regulatory subunit 4